MTIIPYQEQIGNYNGRPATLVSSDVIPYQEQIENYNIKRQAPVR